MVMDGKMIQVRSVVFIFFIFIAFVPGVQSAERIFQVDALKIGPPVLLAQASGGEKGAPQKKLKLEEPKGKPGIFGPGSFGKQFTERVLDLGVGQPFIEVERSLFKAQIKTFIPPLLQPVVGNSAFILPPNTWQVATNFKFANLVGDDFFLNGNPNPTNRDKGTRRQFLTLSIRYGFDLNMKYLHSFTVILNVPWQNSHAAGSVFLPSGAGPVQVDNGGSIQGLGDISLFLKKKVLDQANENRLFGIRIPVGLAIAGGIFFPTGDHNDTFGNNGTIRVVPATGCGMTPGGAPVCPTPTFKRFGNDGRGPSFLQPGTGTVSFKFGAFFTRQFVPGDMPDFLAGTAFDRAALHWGMAHRLNFKHDGVDAGDKTTLFAIYSMPVYKDWLSLQVNSINFYRQFDSYDGVFCAPNNATCQANPALAPARQSATQGWTSLFGPSFIYSPDPVIRLTATALFRIKEPNLGPAPPWVVQLGTTVIF